jgi:hypothetical protein
MQTRPFSTGHWPWRYSAAATSLSSRCSPLRGRSLQEVCAGFGRNIAHRSFTICRFDHRHRAGSRGPHLFPRARGPLAEHYSAFQLHRLHRPKLVFFRAGLLRPVPGGGEPGPRGRNSRRVLLADPATSSIAIKIRLAQAMPAKVRIRFPAAAIARQMSSQRSHLHLVANGTRPIQAGLCDSPQRIAATGNGNGVRRENAAAHFARRRFPSAQVFSVTVAKMSIQLILNSF